VKIVTTNSSKEIIYVRVYIYIYRERERERENENGSERACCSIVDGGAIL
jgi:hypothetical protein